MRKILALVVLAACSTTIAPVDEPEPCVTFVVTMAGDTVQFVALEVPPENLNGIVDWWTEGDCE